MNIAKFNSNNRLFLAVFFSFLSVVVLESVAVGDLFFAPSPAVTGRGTGFVDEAAGAVTPQPNRIYSARELVRRTEEPGPFHNFPELWNEQIFTGNRRVISPDYIQCETRGAIALPGRPIYGRGSTIVDGECMRPIIGHTPSRNLEGTFEIGVRPSASGRTEVVTHRFFRAD